MTEQPSAPRSKTSWRPRLVVLLVLVVLILLFLKTRDSFSLDFLIQQQETLRNLAAQHPWQVFGAAFLVYVLVTGLSLPGAAMMTIVYGWLFGFWPAVLMISFASTTGATIAFLLSRFLFRDAIQARFQDRLIAFNQSLQREGAFYLFTLRLIPQVPFFLVNLLMGLTPIRVSTFWWVSQLGMLPGTALFVYTGTSIGNLEVLRDRGLSGILTWQLALAFVLLGLFPLLVKKVVNAISAGNTSQTNPIDK